MNTNTQEPNTENQNNNRGNKKTPWGTIIAAIAIAGLIFWGVNSYSNRKASAAGTPTATTAPAKTVDPDRPEKGQLKFGTSKDPNAHVVNVRNSDEKKYAAALACLKAQGWEQRNKNQ